jgi:hypothetical protein
MPEKVNFKVIVVKGGLREEEVVDYYHSVNVNDYYIVGVKTIFVKTFY